MPDPTSRSAEPTRAPQPAQAPTAASGTRTDPPRRIVSLLPSATEMLALLGVDDRLVGRSHECDHPSRLASLPILTRQRTDPNAAPADIDRQVSDAVAAGESLYELDTPRLHELAPDLIVTQDLCDVCSIDLPAVQRAARELGETVGVEPRVVSLNPQTVEGVLDDILLLADAVGEPARGRAAVAQLRDRMDRAAEFATPFAEPIVVGFMEWTDPIFIGGHWVPQLIERAGGAHPLNPCVAKPGSGAAIGPQQAEKVAGKSIAVTPEVFAAAKPEALVICPCGVALDGVRAHAEALARQPWFAELPAVRTGKVALVDGNQMFSRPGPRLAEAFAFLCGFLNDRPELIPDDFPWQPMR